MSFAEFVRGRFQKVTKSYEERRLEPLPARESSFLEDWILTIEHGEQKQLEYIHQLITESRYLESAMENGFRPSEYIDSVFELQIQRLRDMGVEPEKMLPSGSQIWGITDYIEFNCRLSEWFLSSRGKYGEFKEGLEDSSAYQFWSGCSLKGGKEFWELARDCFRSSLEGSLSIRMRFVALQSLAWCYVELEEWDDALPLYDELRKLAKTPDTKEKVAECAGYVIALRDFEISPGKEIHVVPSPQECEELDIVAQAEEVLASKSNIVSYSRPTSTLQEEMEKTQLLNDAILERLSRELGSVVDQLPSEVTEALLDAEMYYLFMKKPPQAIIDLYEAVAQCLQYYVGTKLRPFVKDVRKIAQMGVRDWAILLENIDRPSSDQIKSDLCRSLWEPFIRLVELSVPRLDESAVKLLVDNLHKVQDKRNPYGHPERDVQLSPKPSREQRRDLEEMHRLVIGSDVHESVIKQIVNLFAQQ